MPWDIDIVPSEKMIVIAATGKVSFVDIIQLFEKKADFLKNDRTVKMLVNLFRVDTDTQDLDIYLLPLFYDELRIDRHSRIAVAMPRRTSRFKIYSFYETVCRNHGYTIKLFDTRETAEHWLGKGEQYNGVDYNRVRDRDRSAIRQVLTFDTATTSLPK